MYSVVIPLHNESGNITSLIEEVHDVFTNVLKRPYELVLVDDASVDDTADVVQGAMKTNAFIRLFKHSKQAGQSRALKTGIEAAKGQVIITLDGDGQNNPVDIPALMEAFEKQNEAGLVIGHRQKRKDSGIKHFVSRLAFKFRLMILKDGAPDTGCGLKIFPKSLFLSFPYFNNIHRYFPALTRRIGLPVESVRISHRARGSGRSNYGIFDRFMVSVLDIIGVWWLIKRYDREVQAHEL